MAGSLKKKILYFVKGLGPTDEEQKKAVALGTLSFRSAQSYHENDPVENCDGVAGAVPARYAEKYPVLDKPAEKPAEPPPPPPAAAAPPPPPPPPPPSGSNPNPFAKTS